MGKASNNVLIIDGYGILFRAYYAVPEMIASNGVAIGAINGFFSILLKILKDVGVKEKKMPVPIVIALDSGARGTFRHKIYDEYKANRSATPDSLIEQMKILPEFLDAFGIKFVSSDSYEADDCIATYVRMCKDAEESAIVISNDKDLLQLLGNDVAIFDHLKSQFIDAQEVTKKFAVKPSQIADYLSLVGDSSDNVPGIKGIGPKAASKVLSVCETIEDIYTNRNNLHDILTTRVYNLLMNGEDMARISKKLVTLAYDVPDMPGLSELNWFGLQQNDDKIFSILSKYGLNQLRRRVDSLIQEVNKNVSQSVQPLSAKESDAILSQFIAEVRHNGWIAITSDDKVYRDAVMLSFPNTAMAWNDNGQTHTVKRNILLRVGNKKLHIVFADRDALPESLRELFNDNDILKICVNYSRICHVLNVRGNEKWHDLNVMHYALSTESDERIDDVESPKARYDKLRDMIECDEATKNNYYDVDSKLADIIVRMENKGIKVDVEYLRALNDEFLLNLESLEDKIYAESGCKFNIASPSQVSSVLFENMGLHKGIPEYSNKMPGTGVEVLEKLYTYGFTIAHHILEWRRLFKLRTSYINGLIDAAVDDRVHCTFHSHLTLTGRFSTSNPNLQSIPVKTHEGRRVRSAFIASDGHMILSADYSQIEMRVLAHKANCNALIDVLNSGRDIHAITASEIFGVAYENITADLRRKAKAINFGIVYGISPFGLARNIGVSNHDASSYMKRYMSVYDGIEKYMNETIESARDLGYVKTFSGRKCYINNINNANATLKKAAERVAINAPIQGGAADIIRIAMVKLCDADKDYLMLQVHDELVFEIPEDMLDIRRKEIVRCMEGALKMKVDLVVDVSADKRYS